ncbi:P-loop containing nucleoside triphosphate hydrolase protein [Trichoderma camerunense]
MDPEAAVDGEIANSFTALTHVRKYIEFVEKEILPLWERAAENNQRKVRFLDPWMSFQPGELLYVPPASESPQSSKKANASSTIKMHQTAWRLYFMSLEGFLDEYPDDFETTPRRDLRLYSYYIDYNGSSFGPVRHFFSIPNYEGEKDITILSVYPMRFIKDFKDKIKNFFIQGQQFQDVMNKAHLYYDGWTLTHGPTGNLDSNHEATSEHIDSNIIIDFAEGYKADSTLRPPSFEGLGTFDDGSWPTGNESLQIKNWADKSRDKLLREVKVVTQRNEWLAEKMRKRHQEENKFLTIWKAENNAIKDLKIYENHKIMVKSLVKTHFQKQNIQKQRPQARLNQDLIRGKGSGLVILLHGVPGVGKTATAEAVAQANKKPLFTITCGDLGFTPKEVETSLRDIFRLAHLWDCVLLLDEADIFLSRREVSDLNRNALVSYYSGILFLTTNRVGSLDEAFKSRIHVSLYYPPLGRAQTLAIFGVNIRKLSDIEAEKQKLQTDGDVNNSEQPALKIDNESILHYAAWHYDNHEPHERWNGRQIRNAFQIAYSLAQFDMQKVSKDQADEDNIDINFEDENAGKNLQSTMTLNYKQFQIVANAIERFDAYLYDAIAGSDMDNARNLLLRADDHNPTQWNHGPAYRPPSGTKHQSYTYTPGGSQQRSNQVRPGPQKGQYNNHIRPESRSHLTKRQEYQPPQQDPRLPLRQQRRQVTPQKENLASQEQLSQLQTSPEPQLVQRQRDNLRPPGQGIAPNAKRSSTIMKGYTGGNNPKLHKSYQEDYQENYRENYHENHQEDYQEDYHEDYREDYREDYQGDYQGDYQEGYQEGYKEGYQGSYQGSHQGDYQED